MLIFFPAVLPLFQDGCPAAKRAPVFSARDITGKMVNSGELAAKGPVIIYFWNVCCAFKMMQVIALKQFHSRYGSKGLHIVAVNEDPVGERAGVRQTIEAFHMPFTIVMDEEKTIRQKFKVMAEPSLLLIDRDNTIISFYQGYIPGDEMKLQRELEKLFPEQGSD